MKAKTIFIAVTMALFNVSTAMAQGSVIRRTPVTTQHKDTPKPHKSTIEVDRSSSVSKGDNQPVINIEPVNMKYGVVNTQTIMSGMPEIAKINTQLQSIRDGYEKQLKRMQDELQRASDDYEQRKTSMNPSLSQNKEQELQSLYGLIQQKYQNNQKDLEEKQNDLMQPVIK